MTRALSTIWLVCLTLAAVGCGDDDLDLPNRDAELSEVSVEPVDANRAAVWYTVRDAEGDDQAIAVELCAADGDGCVVPQPAAGGDGLATIPTVPAGQPVRHVFHWTLDCATLDELEALAPDGPYIARVTVVRAGVSAESEPFGVEDLGISPSLCE